MAIPQFVSPAGTGITDAGGAWSFTGTADTTGHVFILQILQDGTTSGAVAITSATNMEDLAGTDNTMTEVAVNQAVGNPTAALQHIYIGRYTATAVAPVIGGSNSTSEDLYIISFSFMDVNTGTTLSSVIENGSAGATANEVATGTTVSDTAVATLGVDRLALNFIGMNDDPTSFATEFSGETGGDWVLRGSFGSSTGTDGAVIGQTADMASSGTINGGSYAVGASTGIGVIGFALIGTTVETQIVTRDPWPALDAVRRSNVW